MADSGASSPNDQPLQPAFAAVIGEMTAQSDDFYVGTGERLHRRGARFKLEAIDGDSWYFRTRDAADRFVRLHGFHLVTEEQLEALRRSRYAG